VQISRRVMSVGVILLFFVFLYWSAAEIMQCQNEKEVIAAVLDTGYLGENSRVIGGMATIGSSRNTVDDNGHGTRIAEIILNGTEENVKILPIKIADYMGCSTEEAAYQGIKYALDCQVDIIHISLNMSNLSEDSELRMIFDKAIEAGIEVVVSAGNSGKDTGTVFPANVKEAIVVSAVNEKNEICSYSNYGNTIDFAADGYYMGESGTSYSAARVTAMLAGEYSDGGDLTTLREKAVDVGSKGKDIYYGDGVLRHFRQGKCDTYETVHSGKSKYDIGYEILDIDWRNTDSELLDKYFVETHGAYVGMYLSKLDKEDLEQLKEKSMILNSNVLLQDYRYDANTGKYLKEKSYEENFAVNVMQEYQEHEKQLTISAEWLILKKYAYFVISSENREDIFHFRIEGFSYTTATPDSVWYKMFEPEKLSVTRTTVKQTTDFGAVEIAGFATYLCSGNSFAWEYVDPNTGEQVVEDNFFAIDSGVDVGTLNYGLSIMIEGYENEREGYHTDETDIILMPYDYTHSHEEYSYEDYKEPLRYIFSYYSAATNSTQFADSPQEIELQKKNFKKLINVDQTLWYNGRYKNGYDYSDVDESLSLEEKIEKYLKSYSKKTISNLNVYSTETSLHETGFIINADLSASLGIQWNNGETSTIAVQNDIPEYNFPLIINTYEIVYDGNGATGGGMLSTSMEYNEQKNLEANQYSRLGYLFKGWSRIPDGEVEFLNEQEVCNLTLEHNVQIILYAVWDEYPWIIAEDLYFTLTEARNGEITYEKLMEYARAEDREAGGVVLPGIDEEKGTSFVLLDYELTDYTELLQEDNIVATYQVTDSAGNVYEKQIIVHIVDTASEEELPEGTTRFINEKYYEESQENGGLEANSIWLTNEDYMNVIQEAFENVKNDTPVTTISISHEEILLMKEFMQKIGVENLREPDMLQTFFEKFLADDMGN